MNKRIIFSSLLSIAVVSSSQAVDNRFLPAPVSLITNAVKDDLVALFIKALGTVEKTNWSSVFNPLNAVIKEIERCTNNIRDILLSNITALNRLDEINHKKVWKELMVAISGGCDCVDELPIPTTYGQALAIQAEGITESLTRIGFSEDSGTLTAQLMKLRALLGEPALADSERAKEMVRTIDTIARTCYEVDETYVYYDADEAEDRAMVSKAQLTVFALLELLSRQSTRLQTVLREIKKEVNTINAKIGNLSDPSIDPLQLVYASDVDTAELTIIQWLKTMFRAINNGPIS